jgi:hypothetical protein
VGTCGADGLISGTQLPGIVRAEKSAVALRRFAVNECYKLERESPRRDGIVQPGTRNRFRIAVLIYSMTNAVIFGAGIITVLNVSALRADAYFWIPVVVVASLILAAPFAWLIAPRLQARYDRGRTN